ncbi:MAG: AsmA family protein [Oligoflexia bacterium]|nr:AsmA family protein [Oligoflexia bacterium]
MMKKIAIGLVILVLLAAGALGFAAYNINSLVAVLKPELEKAASQALGKPVEIASLGASVFPETRLELHDLKLGQENSAQRFSLGTLYLKVALAPLLKRQIAVTELALQSPEIFISKSAEGHTAVQPREQRDAARPAAMQPDSGSAPAKPPLELKLDKFSVSDGKISYRDQQSGRDFTITELDLSSSLSVADQISLPTLKGSAVLASQVKLSLEGSGLDYDLQTGAAKLTQLTLGSPAGSISLNGTLANQGRAGELKLTSPTAIYLDKLASTLSALTGATTPPLSGSVDPNLNISFNAGLLSADGTISLTGVGVKQPGAAVEGIAGLIKLSYSGRGSRFASPKLSGTYNGAPFSGALEGQLLGNLVQISRLNLDAFEGTLNATGSFARDSQDIAAQFDARNLTLEKLNTAFSPGSAPKITGRLERLAGKINGRNNSELKQNLNGDFQLLLVDGAVPGINLAQAVLKSVKDLPFLTEALIGSVPPEFNAAVNSDNTKIDRLQGSFNLNAGTLSTNDLQLQSDLFDLQSAGRVGLDGTLKLTTSFLFNPNFSRALVARTPGLKHLIDQEGRLVIPLVLEGTAPRIIVLPDLAKLARSGAGKVLQEKAGDLLNKALKGKGGKGLGGLLGF